MKSKLNLLAIVAALSVIAVHAEDKRPNVLFIAIDDLRPELGCYGAEQIKTPNIDRFAEQALVFDWAYCQIPVCGASRASLMTGVLPTKDRFWDYKVRADEDVPDAVTLPQVFKEAGYTTMSNGKVFHHAADMAERSWSEMGKPTKAKFKQHYDPESVKRITKRGQGRIYEAPDVPDEAYRDGEIAQNAIEDLKRLKEEGKPFFYALGFVRPHLPFYAPKKYWDLYQRDEIELAGNPSHPEHAPEALRGSGEYKTYDHGEYERDSEPWQRMMIHGYYASTSYVDQLTGSVLNALKELGLAENTIVVIWGDHGWHLGEHGFWGKHNTMHLAMRVPLIIRVPGMQGGKTGAVVEVVDLFPTLCGFAGLDVPETVQGRSFGMLFQNPEQEFREFAYSRFKEADAVVTERYVFSRYFNGETMLYDRQKDPQENVNVAGNPEYRNAIAKLEKMLDEKIAMANEVKSVSTHH